MAFELLYFEQSHQGWKAGTYAGFPPKLAKKILGLQKDKLDKKNGSLVGAARIARPATKAEAEAAAAKAAREKQGEPDLVAVTFNRKYNLYNVGETAGFPAEVAKRLVEGWKSPGGQRFPSHATYFKRERLLDASPTPQPATAAPVQEKEEAPKATRKRKVARKVRKKSPARSTR